MQTAKLHINSGHGGIHANVAGSLIRAPDSSCRMALCLVGRSTYPQRQIAANVERRRSTFPSRLPDFIVQLLSLSDNLVKTKAKLEAWINNGVGLCWLLDPL